MNTIGIEHILDRPRIKKLLVIGLCAYLWPDGMEWFHVKGMPFPKWYCVFNLLIGQVVFNAVRQLGNTPQINGIGTSNKSLGAIVMFTALLLGWRKYVSDQDFAL